MIKCIDGHSIGDHKLHLSNFSNEIFTCVMSFNIFLPRTEDISKSKNPIKPPTNTSSDSKKSSDKCKLEFGKY